jgi:hypothetical protein
MHVSNSRVTVGKTCSQPTSHAHIYKQLAPLTQDANANQVMQNRISCNVPAPVRPRMGSLWAQHIVPVRMFCVDLAAADSIALASPWLPIIPSQTQVPQ